MMFVDMCVLSIKPSRDAGRESPPEDQCTTHLLQERVKNHLHGEKTFNIVLFISTVITPRGSDEAPCHPHHDLQQGLRPLFQCTCCLDSLHLFDWWIVPECQNRCGGWADLSKQCLSECGCRTTETRSYFP